MNTMMHLVSLFVVSMCLGSGAHASDRDDLEAKLHAFLANSDTKAAHVSFWADDLVYTSSNGTRFGKAELLSGFENAEPPDAPAATVYSAADVDIRVYGDAAVVAFKLVGTPTDATAADETTYYFNTGTFLKRDGEWRAVAWQATIIP
ncbi:MAG: nuclear transport factor 2 family protein [Pseudomonadota bacterium]